MNDREAQDAFERLLDLPEGDPRRSQLLRDPAVRALHANYQAFLAEDGEHVPGTDRAEHALTAWREREIELPRATGAGGGSRWAKWFAPSLRPAWGLAAVLLATVTWFAMRPGSAPGPVLRGGPDGAIALLAPRAVPGGTALGWTRHPEADAYEVVLYSEQLEIVRELPVTAETTLVFANVERLTLPATLLYRVVARAGGDEVGRSDVRALTR